MSRLLSRKINPLIGLAAEAYQHNKDKKTTPHNEPATASNTNVPPYQDPPPDYDTATNSAPPRRASSASPSASDSDADSTDNDEDDWVRDETQSALSPTQHNHSREPTATSPDIITSILSAHPNHLSSPPFTPLPAPVIIPQRRPNAKSRGFIRAYAPVLHDAGIDQSLFLDFITGFERAVAGQGYFTAFNIAVGLSVIAETAAHGPSITVHLAAMAVHISIETGRRLYESHKTNSYIDGMNDALFKPHGLYAVIMSYQPHSSSAVHTVDPTTNAISAREGGHRSKFRAAAGPSTDDQLPACAPLVFPHLDTASDQEKTTAFKRAMAFLDDYADRRAQATWQDAHPDSQLNVPGAAPAFASRFGDPRHAAYHGGIVNLLSGGRAGGGGRRERRALRDMRRTQRREVHAARTGRAYGPGGAEVRNAEMGNARSVRDARRDARKTRREQGLTPVGLVKRTLGEDTLYLMIVNMPSEAELAAARAAVAKRGGLLSLFSG